MNILAVKLADLGDLLLCEPALRSIEAAFPDACIDLLTTPGSVELLQHLSPTARAIAFDKFRFDEFGGGGVVGVVKAAQAAINLRQRSYDMVLLFHHLTTGWGAAKYRALTVATGAPVIAGLDNGRGTFLTHRALDRGFGSKAEYQYMVDVSVAAGGVDYVEPPRFTIFDAPLPFDLPERFIAIAPAAGAFSGARIWPAERFAAVAIRAAELGYSVVVIGGSDAVAAGQIIDAAAGSVHVLDLTGKTTINQTAQVLRLASALISNDSFPGHLASAVGTPVVSIFGPSNRRAWTPAGPNVQVVSADLPCSPCLYTGYRLGRRVGCPTRSCMVRVTTSMVVDGLKETVGA